VYGPRTLTVGRRPFSASGCGAVGLNAAVPKQSTSLGQDRRGRGSDAGDPLVLKGPSSRVNRAWRRRFGACSGLIRSFAKGRDEAYADYTAANPEAPESEDLSREISPYGGMPAEARRVHARLYDDAEEAELGAAQGRQDPPDERL